MTKPIAKTSAEWLATLNPGDRVVVHYDGDPYEVLSKTDRTLTLRNTRKGYRSVLSGPLIGHARRNTLRPPYVPPAPLPPPPLALRTPVAAKPPRPQVSLPERAAFRPPATWDGAVYDVELPPALPKDHDRTTACVYRLFRDNDMLQYVGSTYDPHKRLREHRNGTKTERPKAWWFEVHHYTLEWFPNRMLADLAEHTAIVHEDPVINSAGRTGKYLRTTVR